MNIFVVVGDPGSANATFPVIEKCLSEGLDVSGVSSGSATDIFRQKGFNSIEDTDDDLLSEDATGKLVNNKASIVLSGAGAFNMVEHTIRRAAYEMKIPSVAVLDYWTNYMQRFFRFDGNKRIYSIPDKICVMDEQVKTEMLFEGFQNDTIIVTGQPYFEYIQNWKGMLPEYELGNIRKKYMKNSDNLMVGFCTEPIEEDRKITGNNPGYNQYTTLETIFDLLNELCIQNNKKIHLVIRPHPREKESGYSYLLNKHNQSGYLSLEISKTGSSLEFVASCDMVTGMRTMALIEACFMKKIVISYQPGLKQIDHFLGTTRGFCPSIYERDNLRTILEKWIQDPGLMYGDCISNNSGAAENIISVMKSIV